MTCTAHTTKPTPSKDAHTKAVVAKSVAQSLARVIFACLTLSALATLTACSKNPAKAKPNQNDVTAAHISNTQAITHTIQNLKAQFPKTAGDYRYYDIAIDDGQVVYKITALNSEFAPTADAPNFDDFAAQVKRQTRLVACTNSAEMSFFKHGVEQINYKFMRKNGKPLITVSLSPDDCKV